MSNVVGHRIRLFVNAAGEVLDHQGNALPLRIHGFCILGPSESEPTDVSQSDQTSPSQFDPAAWVASAKWIALNRGRMLCNDENLGELRAIDLQVTGDVRGFVTVQFPVS